MGGTVNHIMTANPSTPPHALDLLSTSPNFGTCAPPACIYGAPYIAFQIEGKWYVSSGNCHHWDCPRCGQLRAKAEYWRIVQGAVGLSEAGYPLYFQTITTRGKGLPVREAEAGYLAWTNRLLDAYRARVKKQGGYWAYVQVTERQKRRHPHSHILTTFEPGDLEDGFVEKWKTGTDGRFIEKVPVLRSPWLRKAVGRAGLGEQYDISRVKSPAAVSRYIGKYLFKQMAHTADWPKGWKRVRYSQNWPKPPDHETTGMALLSWDDWRALSRKTSVLVALDTDAFEYASWRLLEADTLIYRSKRAD